MVGSGAFAWEHPKKGRKQKTGNGAARFHGNPNLGNLSMVGSPDGVAFGG